MSQINLNQRFFKADFCMSVRLFHKSSEALPAPLVYTKPRSAAVLGTNHLMIDGSRNKMRDPVVLSGKTKQCKDHLKSI